MVRGQKRKIRGLIADELSTIVGATVTVTPTGNDRVKKTKDPLWMEDDENQEVTNEVADGEAEVKKQKLTKDVKPDDDSEDEMADKEMAYMQKVADEEEEMEKTIEASEDKLKDKLNNEGKMDEGRSKKKRESDSEEEDGDVDDAAEAENLLSDG